MSEAQHIMGDHLPQSVEHSRIKELMAQKLKEWFGCSIQEYPSSGQNLDVFAVTISAISIYVEVIWSTSEKHFIEDLLSVERSHANAKLVIVNPEICSKMNYLREFEKTVANQRLHGVKIYGDLIDGAKILKNDTFLNVTMKEIFSSLIEQSQNEQAMEEDDDTSGQSENKQEIQIALQTYARNIFDNYNNFSCFEGSRTKPVVVEQLCKFDFKRYYVPIFVQDLANRLQEGPEKLVERWLNESLNGCLS